MCDRLSGKFAVVTGGAGGIGSAVVKCFVAEGARVLVIDKDSANGQRLVQARGDAASFRAMDVTSEADWDALSESLRKDPPAIVVNVAGGLVDFRPLHEIDLDTWHREFDANATSVFLSMRTFIRLMLVNGGGSIVNMGSTSGVVGQPDPAGYQATKRAVR